MFLDTHAVVFLHAGRFDMFTETGLELLEEEKLHVSPMVILELQYLYEIGRLRFDARTIRHDLEGSISLRVSAEKWEPITHKAQEMDWTRDPFDRMIAAQALVESTRLLTRDRKILRNCSLALW